MFKYRIVFRSGKEVRIEVPQLLDFNNNKGNIPIPDRIGKQIGSIMLDEVCFIQKLFVEENRGNEKNKDT